MQVSIWREFSSNHSTRFTVVGVFASPAEAQAAAARLGHLMRDIAAWYAAQEPPGNAGEAGDGPPTPPELAAAEALAVPWSEQALDWVWADEAGHSPVKALESLVFIDGTESNMGAYPADLLIERLGGVALVDGFLNVDESGDYGDRAQVTLHLTCQAPNEATAASIETAVDEYLTRMEEAHRPGLFDTPWRDFMGPGFSASSFEGTLRREGLRLSFEEGEFFHIGDGFPAMLAWLRAQGCDAIEYTFTEEVLD